jgi:serine protease Do
VKAAIERIVACFGLVTVLGAPFQFEAAELEGVAEAADEAIEEATEQQRVVPFALPASGPARRDAVPEAFGRRAPGTVQDLKAMEDHLRELVARVSPAVVGVRVGGSTGSGVIISGDGLVLTAAHVSGAPGREVRFTFPDGRTASGTTLGTDHGTDSGLMRITEEGDWPYAGLGEADSVALGDWVMALGHPGGFDEERPVVVRLGRVIWRSSGVIRTDSTLMSGDSGGPLFDVHGRVVGIHSRISESTAANFHVPVGSYVASWERLARGENWGGRGFGSRTWVGVRGTDDSGGCRLERVWEGGPAHRAGLREGDVVTRIDRKPVKDYAFFLEKVSEVEVGDTVMIEVVRGNERLEVEVTVEARRRGRGPPGER